MCRGFQQTDQTQRLFKIKSFHIMLSLNSKPAFQSLPESLTLHYLPRITGGPLEVNGSVVKPHVPVFVTLYRVVTGECKSGDGKVVYVSRERVMVSEGVRFEVYVKEDKVVKGGFRRDACGEWRMECRCGLEGGGDRVVKAVEVVVEAEDGGTAVMREKVEMVVRRKRRCFEGLEEIPEQESEGEEVEVLECCCCCECGGGGGDGAEDGGCEVELEVEGVRWAVDVGIWVVCLGVGYLVSKASSKSVRRRRRLL